jgi:hypothetical protein
VAENDFKSVWQHEQAKAMALILMCPIIKTGFNTPDLNTALALSAILTFSQSMSAD